MAKVGVSILNNYHKGWCLSVESQITFQSYQEEMEA